GRAGGRRSPDWERKLEGLLDQPRWVMDGTFLSTLAVRLRRCDAVIFLDFSRPRCYWGILRRYARDRGRRREDMAEGCVETSLFDLDYLRWVCRFTASVRPAILELLAACP